MSQIGLSGQNVVYSGLQLKEKDELKVVKPVEELKTDTPKNEITKEGFRNLEKGIDGGGKNLSEVLKTVNPKQDIEELKTSEEIPPNISEMKTKFNTFSGQKNGTISSPVTEENLSMAKDMLNKVDDSRSSFFKDKHTVHDFLHNPKISKTFDDFAKKENSFENNAFIRQVKSQLNKPGGPTLVDLKMIDKAFIDFKSPMRLDKISQNDVLAFKVALDRNDRTGAITALNNIKTQVDTNVSKTFTIFKESSEFKAVISQKNTPTLPDKLMEKIPTTNENSELSVYMDKFKTSLKPELLGNNLTKALDNLEKSFNLPSREKQLQALNSLKSEVDTFIKIHPKSSKIELLKSFKENISYAKTEIGEKFLTTDEGKLHTLNEGMRKLLPELRNSKPENIQSKAKEFLGKDPKGDLAWSVSMLPKEKALEEIKKSFPKQAEKIYEGLKEALPIKFDNDSLKINNEKYTCVKQLGKGGNGLVYLYKSETSDKCVAVKMPLGQKCQGEDDVFKDEAENHRLVSGKPEYENKNVTKFIGTFRNDDDSLCTIQEFANGGGADKLINEIDNFKAEGLLSHTDDILVRQYIAKGMVEGMVHVNDARNMMHLDIKPENFLFDKTTGTVKVADFGTSQKDEKIKGSKIGTAIYHSPEAFNTMSDKKSDIWSLGLTINELMKKNPEKGSKAFVPEGETVGIGSENLYRNPVNKFVANDEKFSNVKDKKGKVIGESPTAYGKALNSMIEGNVDKRAKISELKNSPFFTDPIGSDERAKALIDTIYAVNEKKELFEKENSEPISLREKIREKVNNLTEAEKFNKNRPQEEIKAQIDENKKLSGETGNLLETTKLELETTKNKIIECKENISMYKEDESSLSEGDKSVLSNYEKDLTQLREKQKTLENMRPGLKKKFSELNKELPGLEKELKAPNDIKDLKTEINGLQEKLSKLEEKGIPIFDKKAEFQKLFEINLKSRETEYEKQF